MGLQGGIWSFIKGGRIYMGSYTGGCPNKNKAVACCFSSATALFFLGHLVM